jgi:hypothetical protein
MDHARGRREDVLDREPDAVIPWTGRRMAVAKFIPHLRNEHALHRWDIAGDDETSRQLLGDMDLVDHSVGELGRILLVAGRAHDPDPDSEFHVRLRAEQPPHPIRPRPSPDAALRLLNWGLGEGYRTASASSPT